jgi:lysophospholipase L1-like esterase
MSKKIKIPGLIGLSLVLVAAIVYQLNATAVNNIFSDAFSPTIIGAGDSIMAGGTELSQVADRLSSLTSSRWKVLNVGIGGGVVGREIVSTNISGQHIVGYPWRRKTIVWVLAGTNNIGRDDGRLDVDELLDATEKLFRELHAMGYEKDQCFFTDILRRDAGPEFESDRIAFNSDIAERLADLAHVIKSGSNPALQHPTDKSLFKDGVHPTPAGDKYLAADAIDVMEQVLR